MKHAFRPDDGPQRYTTRRVVFARPFALGSSTEVYPAGPYDVEIKDQAFDTNGHTGHVRTSTVLIIPTQTGICCREVRGSELDHALMKDVDQAPKSDPGENPDRDQVNGAGSAELPA